MRTTPLPSADPKLPRMSPSREWLVISYPFACGGLSGVLLRLSRSSQLIDRRTHRVTFPNSMSKGGAAVVLFFEGVLDAAGEQAKLTSSAG